MKCEEIDRVEADSIIEDTTAEGGIVIETLGWIRAAYACFREGDGANVTTLSTTAAEMVGNFWKHGNYSARLQATHDLRLADVTRRAGLLRRHIEASLDDIQPGDRLILEDAQGMRRKTPPVI